MATQNLGNAQQVDFCGTTYTVFVVAPLLLVGGRRNAIVFTRHNAYIGMVVFTPNTMHLEDVVRLALDDEQDAPLVHRHTHQV